MPMVHPAVDRDRLWFPRLLPRRAISIGAASSMIIAGGMSSMLSAQRYCA